MDALNHKTFLAADKNISKIYQCLQPTLSQIKTKNSDISNMLIVDVNNAEY